LYAANNTDSREDFPRGELNKEVNDDSRLDESLEKTAEAAAAAPLFEKDIENGLCITKENVIPKILEWGVNK